VACFPPAHRRSPSIAQPKMRISIRQIPNLKPFHEISVVSRSVNSVRHCHRMECSRNAALKVEPRKVCEDSYERGPPTHTTAIQLRRQNVSNAQSRKSQKLPSGSESDRWKMPGRESGEPDSPSVSLPPTLHRQRHAPCCRTSALDQCWPHLHGRASSFLRRQSIKSNPTCERWAPVLRKLQGPPRVRPTSCWVNGLRRAMVSTA